MKILTLLILSMILVSCASGVQKLRQINPGMTPEEVTEIMGDRDGFKVSEKDGANFMLYQWTNQLCNGHVSIYDKCDFYVIFKDNKVLETGTKDIRSNAPNMIYMYHFN